jgi:hypothetical protein
MAEDYLGGRLQRRQTFFCKRPQVEFGKIVEYLRKHNKVEHPIREFIRKKRR